MESAIASVLQGSGRSADIKPLKSFEFMHVMTRTKPGLAIMTMLCVLLTSLALEPPFLTVRDPDPLQADKLSYPRTAVVTGLAGAMFVALPKVAR